MVRQDEIITRAKARYTAKVVRGKKMGTKFYFGIAWTKIGDKNPCRRIARYEWITEAEDRDLDPIEQALLDAPPKVFDAYKNYSVATHDTEPREHMSDEIAAKIIRDFCDRWAADHKAEIDRREAKEAEKRAAREKEIEDFVPLVERAEVWLDKGHTDSEIAAYDVEDHALKGVVRWDMTLREYVPVIGWDGIAEYRPDLEAALVAICRMVREASGRIQEAEEIAARERKEREIEDRNRETEEWIATYGSNRLKAQAEQNYNTNPRYVNERVQHDLGDLSTNGQVELKKAAWEWPLKVDPPESYLGKERAVAERLVKLGVASDLKTALDDYVAIRVEEDSEGDAVGLAIVCDYRPGKSPHYKTYCVVIR